MKRLHLIGWMSCITACSQNAVNIQQKLDTTNQSLSDVSKVKYQVDRRSEKVVPESFINWESHVINHQAIERYKNLLKLQGIHADIPDFEFFQTARDWQRCNATEFEVPPQELWRNIVPTLKILDQLIAQRILHDFTVTSVYRNLNLNQCANGASASKHIFNAALDFRIGSETPDEKELVLIQSTKVQICQFWRDYGQQLNMGLGVYPSGQIHIDSAGYRTWGANHRYDSSPCMDNFLNNGNKLDQ
ncbi:D-Ala-D-Ala carboxypeptidase family metallohydrolase [Acinetobacter nematophilus]|uniref:D-Ala-D-Ala carboxypeptidase family metallohydrolase n=1 Tax=Acinetobacter nematophilus TaxID=2994642 RepID=A0A9X3DV16_9GAMM|nr:D-Ala-D-Ala carboxypeptidase family metallohydrolase [Acinetobacter nematophilus]MCX5469035.1 D-Ala-D-Ala carboxypeptidase family metallohydrolase [Acinetobacter nematophilus]